jgi:hypothetical protein
VAWRWLLAKEWRELIDSRAWWAMLALTGPLVGVSFVSAVQAYAEASGLNGTAAGLSDAFSPFDGVYVPAFGGFELVALFLVPFVAIRIVAGDRQSGALKLHLQQPAMPAFAQMTAKALVLLGGCLIASLAGVVAAVLWTSYGGHSYVPEVLCLALGHLLHAGLAVALAIAAASISDHPATAAIATLAVTIGSWVLAFAATMAGGVWMTLAGYTPSALLQVFQRGVVDLRAVGVAVVLIASGIGIGAVWLRLGVPVRRRVLESVALALVAVLGITAASRVRASWDLTENRRNSFAPAVQRVLLGIHAPLVIEAHLAPEDPRRADFDRHVRPKLERLVPSLDVRYVSATGIGLFEQANTGYGEVWYELNGKRVMNRVTTEEAVVETILELTSTPTPENDEPGHRGYPLAVGPRGAAVTFYGLWPAIVVLAAVLSRRRS